MKRIQYRYEFSIGEELFFLGIGESATTISGDEIKVQKITTTPEGIMKHLWISFNGQKPWFNLENGRRTPNGRLMQDFKKFSINHCSAFPKGIKAKEIELMPDFKTYTTPSATFKIPEFLSDVMPVETIDEIENNASAIDAAAWWCENQRELQMLADEMNF